MVNYCLAAACQLACEFCDFWFKDSLRLPPPIEVSKHQTVLHNLRKKNLLWLNLIYGEPFLYPQITEFLSTAKDQGWQTAVLSNGLLFPDFAAGLRGKIDRLFFKIFAPQESENDRLCGQAGAFSQVREATRLAQNLGFKVAWKFPLNRYSVNFLPEMIDLAARQRIHLHLWFYPYAEPLGGFDTESLAYIRRCLPFRQVRLNNALLAWLKIRARDKNQKSFPCRNSRAALTVGPDGDLIYPCFYQALVKVSPDKLAAEQANNSVPSNNPDKLTDPIKPNTEKCRNCLAEEYFLSSFWPRFDRFWLRQLHNLILDWLKGD